MIGDDGAKDSALYPSLTDFGVCLTFNGNSLEGTYVTNASDRMKTFKEVLDARPDGQKSEKVVVLLRSCIHYL